jgi:hypothetical protein
VSIEAQTIVKRYSATKGTARTVLNALADYHGPEASWPSVQTIAEDINLSERQVQRWLRHLESTGEIKNLGLNPHGPRGRQTYSYRINLGPWLTVPESYPEPVDNSVTFPVSGVTFPVSGVTSEVERGDSKTFSGVTVVSPNPYRTIYNPTQRKGAREENSLVDNAPATPSQWWIVGADFADDEDAASFTRWLQEARNIRNPRGFLKSIPSDEIKTLIADFRRERPPPRPVRSEEEQIHMSDHTVGQHAAPVDGCPMCVDGVPAGIRARRAWIENPTRFRLGGGK